jgi:hypothetical protein
MSRSGYSDDGENINLYRAAVDRAMHGARGQHFLRKLLTALDAMPVKRLITNEIANSAGDVCALGAVEPNTKLDPDDTHGVAEHFGIARSMAAEIVYMNDEWMDWHYNGKTETPEQRWTRMRAWVASEIVPDEDSAGVVPEVKP